MKEDKNKFLNYRVTYLEMIKRPSYSYPNCPIKFTNITKSNDIPYWYFISLYKSIVVTISLFILKRILFSKENEWEIKKIKIKVTFNFIG